MPTLYSRLKAGYQKRLVDLNTSLISDALSKKKAHFGRQITVSPTGSGKTFMMAAVIEVGLKFPAQPSFVWLTHNKQILNQTENAVRDALGNHLATVYDIEQGVERYGSRALLFNIQKGISEKKALPWLRAWSERQAVQNRATIFIVDEADEGMSGGNMDRLRDTLQPQIELGFTASFKKKPNEYEFQRATYKEVIASGMLIRNIDYYASEEVGRVEMMQRAVRQRAMLEVAAEGLHAEGRWFLPKMLVQAPAKDCENVAAELRTILGLDAKDSAKQIVVHTQNSRGLEEVSDLSLCRYIVGDLMVERGWNCPEAYVLLSTKDSVSVAKGIQLLGRVIRMPGCEPFEADFGVFNRAYVFVSGRHSIEESCRRFIDDGSGELPGPREVVPVDRRNDITMLPMVTYVDEFVTDLDHPSLIETTKTICQVLDNIRGQSVGRNPNIKSGSLSLDEGAVSRAPLESVQVDWDTEQTKHVLISALSKHFPKGYANVVAVNFQIRLRSNGGLSSIASHVNEMAKKIGTSTALRRIAANQDYLHVPFEWPSQKLEYAQPLPSRFQRSLYPRIQLNSDERKFAHFLDAFCLENNAFWVRNGTSDVKLCKGHYPDFILFSDLSYVFIEFKGAHLLNTSDSVKKNTVGQAAAEYFMVYLQDEDMFFQKGWAGEQDCPLTASDLATALKAGARRKRQDVVVSGFRLS